MYAQKWPLFLPQTREENPLFGLHTKNAGVINNSRGNYQLLPLMGEQLRDLPWHRDFFHYQVSPSNGPKGKFVAKT